MGGGGNRLGKLRFLLLQDNELSTLDAAQLRPLSKLEQLYVSQNRLVRLPRFPTMHVLTVLDLSDNRLQSLAGTGA